MGVQRQDRIGNQLWPLDVRRLLGHGSGSTFDKLLRASVNFLTAEGHPMEAAEAVTQPITEVAAV